MNFELSPQHVAIREKARTLAQTLDAVAIDSAGVVPAHVARELEPLTAADALALVVAVEEVAATSAASAATVAGARDGAPLALAGLRGATQVDASARAHLVLAAVALGIGRAATQAALEELRRATSTAVADVEKPHWVIADVATDLDAARLLTYKAARTANDADIAIARLLACGAASRAVDAAVRVIGAAALQPGSVVERLTRDVRAVSVLIGSEEDQRAIAAQGLLPA